MIREELQTKEGNDVGADPELFHFEDQAADLAATKYQFEFCNSILVIRGQNKEIVEDYHNLGFEIGKNSTDDGLKNSRRRTNTFWEKLRSEESPAPVARSRDYVPTQVRIFDHPTDSITSQSFQIAYSEYAKSFRSTSFNSISLCITFGTIQHS